MITPTAKEAAAIIEALETASFLVNTEQYLSELAATQARIKLAANALAARYGLDETEMWEYVTLLVRTTCLDLDGAYHALVLELESATDLENTAKIYAAQVELSLTGEVTIPIPSVPKDTPSHWPKDVTAVHERRQSRRERLRDQPWRKGHA